ncbi:hypothetical protein ACIRU8_39005 [Streptomyces sp. NPDC101175]|uniref:hypothetical protein n=1 Tax=Streptomyces sp. NPDC101175 TaxID=3366123 RepID=UPI003835DC0C
MALVDDIEFYGSRVDAGEIDREVAVQLLVRDSGGGLTPRGAAQVIDTWQGVRVRLRGLMAEAETALDALRSDGEAA